MSEPANNPRPPRGGLTPVSPTPPLRGGDGGGTSEGMEARVTALEQRVEGVAIGVSSLQGAVASLQETVTAMQISLAKLPTKQDLYNTFLASLALGFAVMAIVIGGIIGGLSWIRSDAAPAVAAASPAPQPIIIQLPPTAPVQGAR